MPPDTTFRRDARTIVIERPVSQTSVVLGGGSSLVWADELTQPLSAIALNAFASGPTSRLFRAVRDELGASYGSTAALPMIGGAARYLVISSSVDPASAAQALAVIRAEYDRFRQEGLTPAEFETAHARFMNGLDEQARRAGPASALLARPVAPGAQSRRRTGRAGVSPPSTDARGRECACAPALAGTSAHHGDRRPVGRGPCGRLRGGPQRGTGAVPRHSLNVLRLRPSARGGWILREDPSFGPMLQALLGLGSTWAGPAGCRPESRAPGSRASCRDRVPEPGPACRGSRRMAAG